MLATLISEDCLPPPMPGKTRVSLSIPRDLMKEFDSMAEASGHPNRSKAVAEAMRDFLSNRKWDLAKKGETPGIILLTYDHHARGVNKALTEVQHDYPDLITASMHIHLSKHTCLEVIAFKGQADRVRSLARLLQSEKGVLNLKVVTSPA
jgi:CopG family nickel-responsive transcriptional regulator